MKIDEICVAKAALLEKSILGYRNSASSGSERTSAAKVGVVKSREPARLAKATDAKVGLFKIRS